jgi:hypothetical protein
MAPIDEPKVGCAEGYLEVASGICVSFPQCIPSGDGLKGDFFGVESKQGPVITPLKL